jgi:hypothetical protein
MKNVIKILGIIALAAIIGFTAVSCGGSNPKSLAEQSVEVTKEAFQLYSEGVTSENDPKMIALKKKVDAIKAKVDKLSTEDQKIFNEEFNRLLEL